MTGRTKTAVWVAAAAIALAAACTKGDNTGSNPGAPSGGGGSSNAATTVTISASGVSPKSITVPRGSQVTFVNSSSTSHVIASDPHPTHGSCPEIESGVSFLGPGQSKQTSNLNTARTCGYHDHDRSSDTSLQGTIVIQ